MYILPLEYLGYILDFFLKSSPMTRLLREKVGGGEGEGDTEVRDKHG